MQYVKLKNQKKKKALWAGISKEVESENFESFPSYTVTKLNVYVCT